MSSTEFPNAPVEGSAMSSPRSPLWLFVACLVSLTVGWLAGARRTEPDPAGKDLASAIERLSEAITALPTKPDPLGRVSGVAPGSEAPPSRDPDSLSSDWTTRVERLEDRFDEMIALRSAELAGARELAGGVRLGAVLDDVIETLGAQNCRVRRDQSNNPYVDCPSEGVRFWLSPMTFQVVYAEPIEAR